MRLGLCFAACLILAGGALGGETPRAASPAALGSAPANTWVKVAESKTGWREQPVLVYVPGIRKFVMASGKAVKVEVAKPKALGKFYFWSEAVYLPDADLLLLMNLFTRPGGKAGNVVWDPNDLKFYWADVKFLEKGKPARPRGFSWSDSLRYDPGLKLCVLNNSSARKVWVMRFDRKAAGLEAIKDQ